MLRSGASLALPRLPGGFMRINTRLLEVASHHRERPPAVADESRGFVSAAGKRPVARGADQMLLDDFGRSLSIGGLADTHAIGLALATRAGEPEPSAATFIAAVITRISKRRGALQAAIWSVWLPDALEGHAIRRR